METMYRSIRRFVFQLTALCLSLPALAAADAGLTDFLAAERALDAGDRATFDTLSARLVGHPLYPYLAYESLRGATDGRAIESFLDAYPDSPLAERLRARYLDTLAAVGRWADYVRLYRDDGSPERQCNFLRASIETGRADEALTPQMMTPLWMVPRSQSGACDPVFDAWRAAGGLTPTLVWGRIRLSMEAGQVGLARYLVALLPESERPWLERWIAVRADPASVTDPELAAGAHWMVPAILADGIGRLARSDARGAAAALRAVQAHLRADTLAWDRVHARVGQALVEDGDRADQASGFELWDQMSSGADNLDAQELRLRAAVRLAAWDWVARWVARMPESEQKGDRWLYWQARAEEALGDPGAGETFAHAAGHRSLWGFLAADRVDLPYRLDHRPVPAEPERIRRIVASPAYARIRALRQLGRQPDMRREWRTLTRDLAPEDLMAAAYVADVLGWHDQAIFTLARTGFWDDLALRFPIDHRPLVSEQAWQTALPESWIFAVIRQESVFATDVASPAGALGLMQLMPDTARQMARDPGLMLDLGSGGLDRSEILDPRVNIALGSGYLARMRDRFGHAALATAAYNAGPHRVVRWLPEHCTDADRWIISIPFRETRGYVERVLAYRVIYANRLGLDPLRISDLLPPVPARAWWAGTPPIAGKQHVDPPSGRVAG